MNSQPETKDRPASETVKPAAELRACELCGVLTERDRYGQFLCGDCAAWAAVV